MTLSPPMIGRRFGRLVVLRSASSQRGRAMWVCCCDCGSEGVFQGQHLRRGKTRSCGCLQREQLSERKTRHGATKRGERWPEWGIWRAMINRCYRPQMQSFERYGGRGITVCDRWRCGEDGKNGFECFIEDMGRRPDPELTIERENNDGNYEPANCKWATKQEQARNRRPWGSSRKKAA